MFLVGMIGKKSSLVSIEIRDNSPKICEKENKKKQYFFFWGQMKRKKKK